MSIQSAAGHADWLVPDWQVPAGVVAYSTTRLGGASLGIYASFNIGLHVDDEPRHVNENRRRLLAELDRDVKVQWLDQVHGSRVIEARGENEGPCADAAFTTQPGIACCVTTADCLPVFLANRYGRAVAIAHAGWRGLAGGVLENTVMAMPCASTDLVAWLGPAIGPCHFEVGGEVRQAFLVDRAPAEQELLDTCFRPGSRPHSYLADLCGLARVKLGLLGVNEIGGGDQCTFCQPERFYSYRRQQRTGRMANLIYLKYTTP